MCFYCLCTSLKCHVLSSPHNMLRVLFLAAFFFLCTPPPPPPLFPEVSPQSTPLPAFFSHYHFIPSASGYAATSTVTQTPPSPGYLLPFSSSCHEWLLLTRMKLTKQEQLAYFLNQPIHNNQRSSYPSILFIPQGSRVAEGAWGNLKGKSQETTNTCSVLSWWFGMNISKTVRGQGIRLKHTANSIWSMYLTSFSINI